MTISACEGAKRRSVVPIRKLVARAQRGSRAYTRRGVYMCSITRRGRRALSVYMCICVYVCICICVCVRVYHDNGNNRPSPLGGLPRWQIHHLHPRTSNFASSSAKFSKNSARERHSLLGMCMWVRSSHWSIAVRSSSVRKMTV